MNDRCDVLVIGGGASGGALAWSLASRGSDVVVLEQGDWVPPESMPKSHADWEVRGRRHWNASPALREAEVDYPVTNLGEDPVDCFFYNAVGGSTIGFGGMYWRLQPSDFRTRTLDEFGVDWPIAYDDLAPYYDVNERMTGVSGLAGDPTGPPRTAPPLPPTALGKQGHLWRSGFESLGWYWWPQDSAIASRDYNGRPACTNRGHCAFGCPERSLGSADVTYWPQALAAGVDLRVRSRVRELVLDERGRAAGAVYDDAEGGVRAIDADRVVICSGGIGTPRLLLMSHSARHPDGLANSSGMVGKNFMVHVQSLVLGRFEHTTDADSGTVGTVASRQFYETDPENDFKRGFIVSGNRGYSPVLTALQERPVGRDHHRFVEEHVNHEGAVYVCGDDEPEPHNRVELDWDNTDSSGLPGVRTHYTLSENSKRLGNRAIERGRELCLAAGAVSTRDFGLSPIMGWHLLGTCRMGTDPAESVIGPNHEAHDVPNLFVADGSLMPTGGAINPTNTIQALALRAADQIWEGRKAG